MVSNRNFVRVSGDAFVNIALMPFIMQYNLNMTTQQVIRLAASQAVEQNNFFMVFNCYTDAGYIGLYSARNLIVLIVEPSSLRFSK
jgi:hypothetical protein